MHRNEFESKYPLSNAIKGKTLVLDRVRIGYCLEDADVPAIVSFLKQHTEISKLDLQCCHIGDMGIKMLMNVDTLSSLDLSFNYNEDFTLTGIQAIADNKNLKSLTLKKKVNDEAAKILAKNQTLEYLNIAFGEVTKKGAAYFAKNNTLKKLNLCYNKIGPAGAILLARNTHLELLNISYGNVGNKGIYAFSKNHTLKNLNLRHNELTDEIAHHFVKNDTLKILDLGENQFTDQGAEILSQNKHLDSLALDANQINDLGIEALAKNNHLKELKLNCSKFGDRGGKALAKNKNLRKLNISSSQIGDATAMALALNTTLEKLKIVQSNISDKGIIALINQNKSLKSLELGCSDKITDKAFMSFKNHNLHKIKISCAYGISEQTKKMIEDKAAQNFRSYQAWMKYGLLIAGVNSNKKSEIKNSIIPIMPMILDMVGIEKEPTMAFNQSCNQFMHTLFFKNRTKDSDEVKHTPKQTVLI